MAMKLLGEQFLCHTISPLLSIFFLVLRAKVLREYRDGHAKKLRRVTLRAVTQLHTVTRSLCVVDSKRLSVACPIGASNIRPNLRKQKVCQKVHKARPETPKRKP